MPQLLKLYSEIENDFNVEYRTQDFQSLVRANNNLQKPIHRWFPLKEAFSCNLLPTMLKELGLKKSKKLKLLDPFCGVGTSIISACELNHDGWTIQAVGVESNPFLHFVAETKAHWHQYSAKRLARLSKQILNSSLPILKLEKPSLTTLYRPEVYSPYRLKKLLEFRQKILLAAQGFPERSPLLVGYARALEELGGFRKDGRALRIVKKKIPRIKDALAIQWERIREDLESLKPYRKSQCVPAKVLLGDGRDFSRWFSKSQEFDLIFYSPPYLNNIDYTEVYKIELWMLGFVSCYSEFKAQRLKTFRSHPSVRFPEIYVYPQNPRTQAFQECLEHVMENIPEDKNRNWRRRLIKSYFDDCYRMLVDQYRLIKKRGKIVCVIGNSLHGGKTGKVLIASDLLIALLAQSIGLEVERIIVARYLKRRDKDNHFLRESVIIMSTK
jgi:DNA modification methylase